MEFSKYKTARIVAVWKYPFAYWMVTITLYIPACAYVCSWVFMASGVVAVVSVPSPKSHDMALG